MGDFYKQGDWNALCAICGFEFKASQLRWNSQINDYVCKEDWEVRHPQERIRAKKDKQSVAFVRTDSYDADKGDADVTLTVGDPVTALFGTDLTANRTVTLSTTGATAGDTFVVNRTGHGAFTLDVGGLYTITNPISVGYAKVQYNGSSWVLKDSGIL